jgi:hypothetical protein
MGDVGVCADEEMSGVHQDHAVPRVKCSQLSVSPLTFSRASPHTERLPGQVSPRLSLKSAVSPHRTRLGRNEFRPSRVEMRTATELPQLTVAAALHDQRLAAAAKNMSAIEC